MRLIKITNSRFPSLAIQNSSRFIFYCFEVLLSFSVPIKHAHQRQKLPVSCDETLILSHLEFSRLGLKSGSQSATDSWWILRGLWTLVLIETSSAIHFRNEDVHHRKTSGTLSNTFFH